MKFKTPTRAAVSLTIGMLLLVAATVGAQNLSENRGEDGTVARRVCDMITRQHISHGEIDDKVSARLFKRYLEQLDGQKLYFLKADIAKHERDRERLDDQLKSGSVEFAYRVFDQFAARVAERVELAHKLIDAEHDFTVDETLIVDGDELDWAATEEEIAERWRKHIKYALLVLKIDGETMEAARDRLHKRFRNQVRAIAQTEDFEKLEMYLSSLTHVFDPHSSYMSPQTLEDFKIQMALRLQGIGAALRSEDGYTIVASIVPGGAADEDGRLKKNDKIVAVDSGDGVWQDIVEMKLSKVVRLIRGPEGTEVKLKVQKPDEVLNAETGEVKKGAVEVVALTRQVIQLTQQEVKGEIIETAERLGGSTNRHLKIGVINIPSFYRDFDGAKQGVNGFRSTSRDVRAVLERFEKQGGVDAVVIDLRMNGGGALTEAIEVSGLFIDNGPVVLVKEEGGKITSHRDDDDGVAWDGPLVVVCNKLSASASEIFAGAIKDYGRGLVVGDSTTHGKGTVQNVMPVPSRAFAFLDQKGTGALKLTISQFYRVNGSSTQSKGVESHLVLPSLMDHLDLGEASLDNALAFDKIEPVECTQYGCVNSDLIEKLKESSSRRIAAHPKFQEAVKEIETYLATKNRKWVPLQEEVLRKERLQSKKQELEAAEEPEEPEPDGPIFPEDHYNDEVLEISRDYAMLLKDSKTALK
ncbi:MAG: carboxy terminal-processing peptidase [Planctomycetes bacterium]|nr:carboxy terminal-processing peptidase [Planctomycetota bacterium]